jgi:anaerobic magnesium-protoporphyrin IX monomethyl ester cyclase
VNHLGVAYIQAYLAKWGIVSKQVIPPQGSTLNDCVKQLISTDAKIFGFTCYDNNYFLVRTITSLIKRRMPESIVIAGGPTATFSDKLLLANTPDIDLCVRFEGEETMLELAYLNFEGILQDHLEDVDGITFRRDLSIIRTPDRRLFGYGDDRDCCLDGLPSPYLEGILQGTEGAGIISARGCTHHCTYCNFSAMSKHTIRYHSIDRVIAELRNISNAIESSTADLTPQTVIINDDAFTLNVSRAKAICERIIDEGIRLKLACLCRADNLDVELVKLLNQAGFDDIIFGVESAIPKVLNNIKKVNKNEQTFDKVDYTNEKRFLSKVKEGIALAKRYKMRTEISIILGLPGETINDGLKTVEFVRDLGVDSYEQNYLMIFSGTELFTTAGNYDIKLKPSEFVLPFDVEYAYPVHEIPFGDNSSLQAYNRDSAKIVLKTFAGGPDTFRGIKKGIVLASIERLDDNSLSDSINWLSKALAVGGRVVVHGKENDTFDDFDFMLRANFRFGLPTNECYYLRRNSIPGAEIIYDVINKPLRGQLLQWNPRFPIVQLSECVEFAKKNNPTKDQIFPVYHISDKIKDIDFLTNLADMMAQQVNNGIIGPRAWLDGVFLDGCRWGKGLCPALKLQRIVINKNGEILPCMTGQPLGGLTDNVQHLRSNARRIYDQMRKERKCGICPADSRCSKCLFPHPLNQQEYCELQRVNLNISGIVTRSNLVNTTELGQ